ncbi:serine/threonine protein kinase ripk4 [Histoplasma capsulatum H143]|uniref:Serine/threonine protein kinase ripk4 n=1 Tax=Ajellomyces capsulatus (strain H143) TaxID=544712 RepID=C6H2F6_AJECH|nr:serine/threonine protein kinase ripk4 [Histoplasma capsulatum H143]
MPPSSRCYWRAGASSDSADEVGGALLLYALYCMGEDMLKLLFKGMNGHDWCRGRYKYSASFLRFCKWQREKDANVYTEDNDASHWSVDDGEDAVVKLLLDKGGTPLDLAVMRRNEVIVRLLLEKGVNTNSKNNHGWTPLDLAAVNRHGAIVRLLLENGAGEVMGRCHWTCVHGQQ